jgi:hypothetical protein
MWTGANDPDAYSGHLRLLYWAAPGGVERPPSLACIEDRLMAPHSPFPKDRWMLVPEAAGRHHVALSVRGVDREGARLLKEAIQAAEPGATVYLYQERGSADDRMDRTYAALRQAKVLVLWISEAYFTLKPGDDNPTLHEFAGAVLAWAREEGRIGKQEACLQGLRDGQRIFVVWDGRELRKEKKPGTRASATGALESMKDHYDRQVDDLRSRGGSYLAEAGHVERFLHASRLADAFVDHHAANALTPGDVCDYAPGSPDGLRALAGKILALARR